MAKNKHIHFRVEDDFPLTSEEVRLLVTKGREVFENHMIYKKTAREYFKYNKDIEEVFGKW